jgi:hypothetical protein
VRACFRKDDSPHRIPLLLVNTTNAIMGQPVSKMLLPPPSTQYAVGKLLHPIRPKEHHENRLLQLQTPENNHKWHEEIRQLSKNVHRMNPKLRDIHHFMDLVAKHADLQALVNHAIFRIVPIPCSACLAQIQQSNQGSKSSRDLPICNALYLTRLVENFHKPTPLFSQREAFNQLNFHLADRSQTSLFHRLGAKDAREVATGEYLYLLRLLTAMFFFSCFWKRDHAQS